MDFVVWITRTEYHVGRARLASLPVRDQAEAAAADFTGSLEPEREFEPALESDLERDVDSDLESDFEPDAESELPADSDECDALRLSLR